MQKCLYYWKKFVKWIKSFFIKKNDTELLSDELVRRIENYVDSFYSQTHVHARRTKSNRSWMVTGPLLVHEGLTALLWKYAKDNTAWCGWRMKHPEIVDRYGNDVLDSNGYHSFRFVVVLPTAVEIEILVECVEGDSKTMTWWTDKKRVPHAYQVRIDRRGKNLSTMWIASIIYAKAK